MGWGGDGGLVVIDGGGECRGVGGIETIIGEGGGIGCESLAEFGSQDAAAVEELFVAKATPRCGRKLDDVGILLLLGIVVVIREGLADLVAEVFKLSFFAFLIGGVTSDDLFLLGRGGRKVFDGLLQERGFGGEDLRGLVLPDGLQASVIEKSADGAAHIESVDVDVFHNTKTTSNCVRFVNARLLEFCDFFAETDANVCGFVATGDEAIAYADVTIAEFDAPVATHD